LNIGTEVLQFLTGQLLYVLTLEKNLSRSGLFETKHQLGSSGLATAGLTNHSQGFFLTYCEADPIDGLNIADGFHEDQAPGDWEIFLQIFDFDQGVFHCSSIFQQSAVCSGLTVKLGGYSALHRSIA
jgi:hypothetical protein